METAIDPVGRIVIPMPLVRAGQWVTEGAASFA